jgi:hypothetical protein
MTSTKRNGVAARKINLLLSLFAVANLVACTYGDKVAVGRDHYAPVPQQKVIVLLAFPDDPSTYKTIGMVSAHGAALASDQAVYGKLQKSAADLGADAVVVGAAARNYRCSLPGQASTTGNVNLYSNGSGGYYSGSYSGNTYYTPPTPLYGLDVNGVAIKYLK